MKRVLAAGLMSLVGACCLAAHAQSPSPPPAGGEVAPQAKPKSGKKAAATKTVKTSNKSAAPAAQNALAPKDAAAHHDIGMGHYEQKRFKEAVEAFQQSIRLGSKDPNTYYNLGRAYYSLQSYKEARESFKRATRIKPDWAEAHYQLGWMYHILGDNNSSQAQYKVLQTLDPEMAAKFQRLLVDDQMTLIAARSTAARPNAAGTKGRALAPTPMANVPEPTPTAASTPVASPTAETSVSTAAATDTTKPSAANETIANSNGNGAKNGTGTNVDTPAASLAATPAKDETAAASPSNAEAAAVTNALPPTEIYRAGVGDVLDIRVLNTPTNRSTLFTVMSGGLIEYPLTGGTFAVAGLTTDEIGARLSAELKRRGLDNNPQVVVGVRDYTSHSVFVSGLVNYPGTKILRREAVPLYVLIAEAQLRPDAGRAVIMRGGESILVNDLTDPIALNVLVKPGDVITVSARQLQYYFIGGRINSPGQKNYQPGLTLMQAILAAGGLSRAQDTVEIFREAPDGRLTPTKYALKDIRSGKIPDPRLQPGDRIEVGR